MGTGLTAEGHGQTNTSDGWQHLRGRSHIHTGCLGSYICHYLETTYDYLETLSKGAK